MKCVKLVKQSNQLRQMASKQVIKLFDIKNKLVVWSLRLTKFFKHRVLTKRKNALLIGGEDTELRKQLINKLSKTWEISEVIRGNKPIQNIDMKDSNQEAVKGKSSSPAPTHISYYYLQQGQYTELEHSFTNKQFDTIIVLPQISQQKFVSIQDPTFVTTFLTFYQQNIQQNMFAYRLASKYLTTSGVVILSTGEKDFLKVMEEKQKKKNETIKKSTESCEQNETVKPKQQMFASEDLLHNQISYLGVVIGDRDHTDLNSWSVIALSQEISQTDVDFVSTYYRYWADGQRLPMPGSFALFKRQPNQTKCSYIQYL